MFASFGLGAFETREIVSLVLRPARLAHSAPQSGDQPEIGRGAGRATLGPAPRPISGTRCGASDLGVTFRPRPGPAPRAERSRASTGGAGCSAPPRAPGGRR